MGPAPGAAVAAMEAGCDDVVASVVDFGSLVSPSGAQAAKLMTKANRMSAPAVLTGRSRY
ncbi:hypothetical protein BKG82_28695 [Mycobacteroides chelonae]|uniref:Uncharacterized protein n=1 Tax=Mycobacteroides chelonae TaxID=1774 RepID=A0A1S1LH25_MYCCH|nr:hypothetical protein BKG82_28695 [Mycobacteroides chelonae]